MNTTQGADTEKDGEYHMPSETPVETCVDYGAFKEAAIFKIFGPSEEIPTESVPGNRLGIVYTRSLLESIPIVLRIQKQCSSGEDAVVERIELFLQQDCMGLLAISGVIWDAGLLLVDFLVDYQLCPSKYLSSPTCCPAISMDKCLDLGCGTGVVGITCSLLGAQEVILTDMNALSCLQQNLEPFLSTNINGGDISLFATGSHTNESVLFVAYNWEQELLPTQLSCEFSTILCSDVLYEERYHAGLMRLLRRLQFQTLILSYKRRHDEPERNFLVELSSWCSLCVVDSSIVQLTNCASQLLPGLYLIIASPKL